MQSSSTWILIIGVIIVVNQCYVMTIQDVNQNRSMQLLRVSLNNPATWTGSDPCCTWTKSGWMIEKIPSFLDKFPRVPRFSVFLLLFRLSDFWHPLSLSMAMCELYQWSRSSFTLVCIDWLFPEPIADFLFISSVPVGLSVDHFQRKLAFSPRYKHCTSQILATEHFSLNPFFSFLLFLLQAISLSINCLVHFLRKLEIYHHWQICTHSLHRPFIPCMMWQPLHSFINTFSFLTQALYGKIHNSQAPFLLKLACWNNWLFCRS
jgi:hypothetical protein